MLGPIEINKFIPDKDFEARASSYLALAFYFMFGKFLTPRRSKMAAILAGDEHQNRGFARRVQILLT